FPSGMSGSPIQTNFDCRQRATPPATSLALGASKQVRGAPRRQSVCMRVFRTVCASVAFQKFLAVLFRRPGLQPPKTLCCFLVLSRNDAGVEVGYAKTTPRAGTFTHCRAGLR